MNKKGMNKLRSTLIILLKTITDIYLDMTRAGIYWKRLL